ncbi:hypothetical protein GCM10008955_38610 [Deinococcus malanensis]|uniref:Uncharacterized protein n=1 Tax=Deinococcus malanensis TaxID=1706855 RepID=A0ABQ2F1N9_9DEIO|nr:hypothetical protein [Deinococcus malanensis]GGK41047.1 hypothetical protein GCM10008955_38610 [Deinococcus malanensis]
MSRSLKLRLALILMVLALVTAVGSSVTAAFLTQGAQLVQRVEPADSASASLFGDAEEGTLIGSPQLLIMRDAAAFLPGTTEGGARLVSETYLKDHGIYPLQAKSVWFIRNLVLLAALVMFVLGGLIWLVTRRGATPHSTPGAAT